VAQVNEYILGASYLQILNLMPSAACKGGNPALGSSIILLKQTVRDYETTSSGQKKYISEHNSFYDILGTPPGAPGAPGLGGPPCWGLGPWNPNLGGGVLSFLASRDLLRTTLEWMAQLTQ